jgi:DNA-binding NtrC family response regulator
MLPIRVLLVDDEVELVSTLAERLSLRGMRAFWEAGALEALGREDLCSFDLAVLDIKLPRMSGLELKEKIEERCPEMMFIFLTGHGSAADFERGAAAAGAHFYIVKPVAIDTLVDKIKRALEGRGADT